MEEFSRKSYHDDNCAKYIERDSIEVVSVINNVSPPTNIYLHGVHYLGSSRHLSKAHVFISYFSGRNHYLFCSGFLFESHPLPISPRIIPDQLRKSPRSPHVRVMTCFLFIWVFTEVFFPSPVDNGESKASPGDKPEILGGAKPRIRVIR